MPDQEPFPVLSVTDLSLSLKSCVEQVFADIHVRGEVSGVKRSEKGYIYFSLKDAQSVLSAICWHGTGDTQKALVEGLEVICHGKLSTYPGRSNYQMIVSSAEPAGVGALLKLLQERKDRLMKEGLFDSARKKKIPFLPETIGVITSPTGAVIRDIIHRITDRCPRHLVLWPVAVQGEEAADQIEKAIKGFNAFPKEGLTLGGKHIPRPDVLIIARGGGSLEDLWCFNEENVVRATAASKIPTISAVGHETDTTLIDYVSDLRAPTPTGAAEKAVPVRLNLLGDIGTLGGRLHRALTQFIEGHQARLVSLGRALPDLTELIHRFTQRLDDQTDKLSIAFKALTTTKKRDFDVITLRLNPAITAILHQKEQALHLQGKLLESYSYKNTLKRGFAFVTNKDHVITCAEKAKNLPYFTVHFSDGTLEATPKEKPLKKRKEDDQPTLF